MSEKVPEGWKFRTLGEVSSIVLGQSPNSKTYNNKGNGLPFFQGKADFGARAPKVKYWCSVPSKVAPKNSILLSVRAPVGDINFSTEKCCIGRGLASITATSVESEFLYQSLLYSKPKFEALGQGSTFEAINGVELKGFIIEIPPLPEQKKIASILTSVDEVIENTQKQIDKLQDFKKATMNELLTKGIGHTEFKDSELGRIPDGWFTKTVGDIGPFFNGLNGKISKDFGQGEPFLTYLQVFNKTLSVRAQAGLVSIDEGEKQEKVRYGDILFTTSSETSNEVGMAAVFLEKGWSPYLNSFCFGLRPKEEFPLNPEFANHFFRGDKFRSDMRPLAQGSTRFNLSKENLKELSVTLPPIPEQKKIASILSSIDENIEDKQQKLQKTQSLKKSLMQDLLTGKVRVQVN